MGLPARGRAYACHPPLAPGELVGTPSFGSRARPGSPPDELELMEGVSAQVAAALERLRPIASLRRRASELAEAARRGPDDPALRSPRDVSERQVQHPSRPVDDLPDVSRIARGKVNLPREAIDLAAVANRAVETVRPLIEEQKSGPAAVLSPG